MLDPAHDRLLKLPDSRLVALVKCPLLDSFSANQPCVRKNLKVFARSWLADRELLRNENAAYTIFHQISIHLARKVAGGGLEPFQDLPSAAACQSSQRKIRSHIDN